MHFCFARSCSSSFLVQAGYTGPVDYDVIDSNPSNYYDTTLLPAHLRLRSAAITGGWFLDLFEHLMVNYSDKGGVFALKGPSLEAPTLTSNIAPLKTPDAADPTTIPDPPTTPFKMSDTTPASSSHTPTLSRTPAAAAAPSTIADDPTVSETDRLMSPSNTAESSVSSAKALVPATSTSHMAEPDAVEIAALDNVATSGMRDAENGAHEDEDSWMDTADEPTPASETLTEGDANTRADDESRSTDTSSAETCREVGKKGGKGSKGRGAVRQGESEGENVVPPPSPPKTRGSQIQQQPLRRSKRTVGEQMDVGSSMSGPRKRLRRK